MSGNRTEGYQWLENHINAASSEIATWPTWKSQSSTNSIGLEDIERAGNWLKNMDTLPYCDIRDKVFAIEKQMLALPQRELSIRYYHGGGVFTGELFIPKGTVLTGKIHKYENLNVMTKGELSVLVGNEIKRIKAPYVVVSPPGTKRIAYAHEDTIWMTFHKTEEVTKEEVEKLFIAQSEQEWLNFCNSQPLLPFDGLKQCG